MATTIRWTVRCTETWPGDSLVVVGSTEALGSWDPLSACHLSTDHQNFPQWQGVTLLPKLTATLCWKLVILRADGTCEWEGGKNRVFETLCEDAFHCQEAHFGWTEERIKPCVSPACEVGDATCVHGALPVPATREDTGSTICALSSSESLNSMVDSNSLADADSDYWLWAGGCTIGKRGASCEDAFSLSKQGLAVADGVGGSKQFAQYGMDAASYATELTQLAVQALDSNIKFERQDNQENSALGAVSAAEAGATAYGASTLCVTCLSTSCGSPTLSAANLGDSGFIVLRTRGTNSRKTVVVKSSEQQHVWNRPYQLMRVPPALAQRVEQVQGGKPIHYDTSDDCHLYEITLCVGDLVLLFTDGFSDNVDCEKLLDLVELLEAEYSRQDKAHPVDPTHLAERLAEAAHLISLDPAVHVPFQDSARKAGKNIEGGKQDDITVVAARVMSNSLSNESDSGLTRRRAYTDMSPIAHTAW